MVNFKIKHQKLILNNRYLFITMINDKQQTASIPAQTVPVYGTINDNDLSTSSIFKSHAYECTEAGADDHTPHHVCCRSAFYCQTNRQRALYCK